MQLAAHHLSKQFGAFAALSDVSLEFPPSQIHAILGENGAGKSTLLKLLFGLHYPSSGSITLDGKPVEWRSSLDAISQGLGMVQQHFSLVEALSSIDNIMLGAEVCSRFGKLNRSQAISHLESLLPSPHLRVPWHKAVAELSVGEKQRIEILKLLFRQAKILFLDEPTAVLTPAEIEDFFSVLQTLKANGKTVVLITHKIGEVMRVCDTYAVLRQGRLMTKGNVADCTADQLVESMIGHRLAEFSIPRHPPQAERMLEGVDLSDDDLIKNISLHVHAGEIVGIAGVEGSGQSPLVEIIMGLRHFNGALRLLGEDLRSTLRARELGLALIPEERGTQGLWLEESCHTNMILGLEKRFVKAGVLQFNEITSATTAWAAEFDVRADSLQAAVGSLSGGNQQKIIFAREVAGRKPRFLLCHQPTRGVDLGAVDRIHRELVNLRNQGLGVLLLSSDLDELLKLCDRLYVLFAGRVSGHFARQDFALMQIGAAMTGVQHEA